MKWRRWLVSSPNAVKIPAIVDADTGFGGAENAGRTIYELERAGLAGCHLEDQEFPKTLRTSRRQTLGRNGGDVGKNSRRRGSQNAIQIFS